MGAPPAGRGRLVPSATLALSVAALAVSIYLTVAHYTASTLLACGGRGTVNCEKVTTSAQSVVFGVPVALLGVVWALAMVGLTLPAAWDAPSRKVVLARLAMVSSGMAFVLWLVYSELFLIGAICLWCTVVHVITFALFVLIVLRASPAQR